MLSSDDLAFFLAVAREPSLAAAARSLSVTPPAVTQRLRGLETRLGVRLFQRVARGIRLSDEGILLAERSAGVLVELDALVDLMSERRGQIRGHLRIAAPAGFGRRHVAPAVTTFLQAHPEVTVSLELSDNPTRLRPDAWDVIVHVGQTPHAAELRQQTLAPNARILCASPTYVANHGAPARPADLAAHRCLALFENDEDVTLWRFLGAGGETTQRIISPLRSNNGEVIRQWALDGLGVMVRSEWDVAEALASGELVRLLPDWSPPDAPVVAFMGPQAGRAARTQSFVETLRTALRPAPWRLSLPTGDLSA